MRTYSTQSLMTINRIINIVREEMMSTDPGKTGDAGFSSKSKNPVAGYDKVMDLRKKYGRKLNMFYRKRLQQVRGKSKR